MDLLKIADYACSNTFILKCGCKIKFQPHITNILQLSYTQICHDCKDDPVVQITMQWFQHCINNGNLRIDMIGYMKKNKGKVK